MRFVKPDFVVFLVVKPVPGIVRAGQRFQIELGYVFVANSFEIIDRVDPTVVDNY